MQWRTIPGWENYEISEYGDVRRCVAGPTRKVGRPCQSKTSFRGYLSVTLYRDGGATRRNLLINRLVCLAFHGASPSPTHQAAHNDGVKTNNFWRNLRWATPKENMADRKRHGNTKIGEDHWKRKLSDEAVRDIRQFYAGRPRSPRRLGVNQYDDMAQKYGVLPSTIWSVLAGEHWGHVK